MPQAIVDSFAKKSGKSKAEVEKAISIAKKEAKDMGKSESKNSDDYWEFVIGVAKKIIGIKESIEAHAQILAEAFTLSKYSSYNEFKANFYKQLSEEVATSLDYPDLPPYPSADDIIPPPKDDKYSREYEVYQGNENPERQEERFKEAVSSKTIDLICMAILDQKYQKKVIGNLIIYDFMDRYILTQEKKNLIMHNTVYSKNDYQGKYPILIFESTLDDKYINYLKIDKKRFEDLLYFAKIENFF